MYITARDLGKRYNREWIFRHFNFNFIPGKSYAITGPNGSGKSTLLQVLAGSSIHSEGSVSYNSGDNQKIEYPFRNLTISAPYLDLIEEMSATEFLLFHKTFKPLVVPLPDLLEEIGLKEAAHKQIRYFSSGMKQRLKMGQAFCSDSSVVLLDEPTTNLDANGIVLYKHLIKKYTPGKLVIVSSNDKEEYDFCDEVLSMASFK